MRTKIVPPLRSILRLKPYWSVLRLRLLLGMQYRTAAFAGVATQFFWGFMYIMIYEAFYMQAVSAPPMTIEELTTYIWLQQSLLALITIWFRDDELFRLITTGNIAYELCRPTGIYGFWFSKLLAQRISSAVLRCFPILTVAFFLPKPYHLMLPKDLDALLLFASSLVLGMLLLVAISMLLYISVFVTMSPTGSLLMFGVLGEFLAGRIIPIPLMPSWLRTIAELLPFHFTADFPFRIYSGHITPDEALPGLVLQVLWLAAVLGIGHYLLGKAMRRVVVQGG